MLELNLKVNEAEICLFSFETQLRAINCFCNIYVSYIQCAEIKLKVNEVEIFFAFIRNTTLFDVLKTNLEEARDQLGRRGGVRGGGLGGQAAADLNTDGVAVLADATDDHLLDLIHLQLGAVEPVVLDGGRQALAVLTEDGVLEDYR